MALDAAGNLYIAAKWRIYRVSATTQRITTVAGSGGGSVVGDGGPATQASLGSFLRVALDPAGNLYIADAGNGRVRRVDATTGIITTVAGTGAAAFSADGGPARPAGLNYPVALAFDRSGHLFIADQKNQRIRRVDASTGVISTIAGDGTAAFGGDGGPATQAGIKPGWILESVDQDRVRDLL